MYAPPADQGQRQAKTIVNLVVVVFLIIGLFLVLQFFHFMYLRDVPVIGNWLMDLYERVFGVPQVLIVHGSVSDDSIGDYVKLQQVLQEKLIFYSEDVDISDFSSGFGSLLKKYRLVIVEDVQTMDKDKLVNFDDYVKGGGNLLWVGDAGTKGIVQYKGMAFANQTGWTRAIACINEISMLECDCTTVKQNSTCKFLPKSEDSGVGDIEEDFTGILGVDFEKNIIGNVPKVEVVDTDHWSIIGIKKYFDLSTVNKITSVSTVYSASLVANINMTNKAYPGVIVNDQIGPWGSVVYFAYPPEETPEILLPLVKRLRY